MDMDTESVSPIACDLAAFTEEQATRHRGAVATLLAAKPAIVEVPGGITFTFLSEPALCQAAMEFATLERLCCPFLTFRLELAPQAGPLTLTLTGPDGTEDILRDFFTLAAVE